MKHAQQLTEAGYMLIISNPEANSLDYKNWVEYKKPKMPTFLPLDKNYRIHKMYVEAFKKGLLK